MGAAVSLPLLDSMIPRAGRVEANFDLVIASQPYRAKSSLNFRAKRIIAPLALAMGADNMRLIGTRIYHASDRRRGKLVDLYA